MRGFYPGRERGCWERKLSWEPEGRLEVTDTWLSPAAAAGVVSRVHFAPGLKLAGEGEGKWGVFLDQGPKIALVQVNEGTSVLIKTSYHPSFGESCARDCLEITMFDNSARYDIALVPA
jgi:hypothetical protein